MWHRRTYDPPSGAWKNDDDEENRTYGGQYVLMDWAVVSNPRYRYITLGHIDIGWFLAWSASGAVYVWWQDRP